MGGRRKNAHLDFFEATSGLVLLLVLVLVVAVAAIGDFNIFFVFIGFFPTILTIIISLSLHEHYAKHKQILWLLPLIIVGASYYIGMATPSIYDQFDVGMLTGVNMILSITYVLIVFSGFIKEKQIKEVRAPKEPTKQTLQDYVHSIEDKSKALNFAVGRVYNKYHGGTNEIREKLRIPAEWYNEFSLIGVGTDTIDIEKLTDLITRFELQLKNFNKTEAELFKDKVKSLKNLIHDPQGNDKILDVLDHNDKDPVKSYYDGALDFCLKIKDEIKNNTLQLVKNDYIPKDDEELAQLRGEETKKDNKKTVKIKEKKDAKLYLPEEKKEEAEEKEEDDEPKPRFSHP